MGSESNKKSNFYIINGYLRKVKDDGRTEVFDLDCAVQGITGTIYVDRTYAKLFNQLIMLKDEE